MQKSLKNRGFTLVETLMALVVLAGTSMIVSNIWSGNKQRVQKIRDYHKIVLLMERKAGELEFEWGKKNFKAIPREARGDFEEEKHFSWSVKTQALKLPDPKVVMSLMGQDQEQSMLIAEKIRDFLSQAVLEAKLTVHYKKGILKSAYSMSWYVVDHNQTIGF